MEVLLWVILLQPSKYSFPACYARSGKCFHSVVFVVEGDSFHLSLGRGGSAWGLLLREKKRCPRGDCAHHPILLRLLHLLRRGHPTHALRRRRGLGLWVSIAGTFFILGPYLSLLSCLVYFSLSVCLLSVQILAFSTAYKSKHIDCRFTSVTELLTIGFVSGF